MTRAPAKRWQATAIACALLAGCTAASTGPRATQPANPAPGKRRPPRSRPTSRPAPPAAAPTKTLVIAAFKLRGDVPLGAAFAPPLLHGHVAIKGKAIDVDLSRLPVNAIPLDAGMPQAREVAKRQLKDGRIFTYWIRDSPSGPRHYVVACYRNIAGATYLVNSVTTDKAMQRNGVAFCESLRASGG